MNHSTFFRYHNKLIRFTYIPPNAIGEDLTGVVLDFPYDKKKEHTEYVFIPSHNLLEWKLADEKADEKIKKKLSRIIDIEYITKASLIHHVFTRSAQIEFDSLDESLKKKLASIFNKITETEINTNSSFKQLSGGNKYVMRYGAFRVFCHIDRFENLVITNIINKTSLKYIGA